jgi:hypothetical protein
MANEFYKGPSRQEKIGANISAQRGPNMQEAIEGNNRRTKSIIQGLDSLVNMSKAGMDKYSEIKTKEAIESGKTKAAKGEARPEDSSFWSGDAEQEAYDDVAAEGAVAGLPSFVEQHIVDNQDPTKPFERTTREERAGLVAKAREAYFKANGLDKSPIRDKADAYANMLGSKQLDIMDRQVVQQKAVKAQAGVSNLVAKTVNAFKGSAQEIDADINARMLHYQQSLGDPEGTKTQTAIVTGLVQRVMSENPSLETLSYLKSPEAKERFGHLEGFDGAVKQADVFSTKAQNSLRVKNKASAENDFYSVLNSGGYTSKEQVQEKLNSIPTELVDEAEKFSWMNKALTHIKTTQAADELQEAYKVRNFGVINSAKQPELLATFERNVMSKNTDIDAVLSADPSSSPVVATIQNTFNDWVKSALNVPTHVRNHFNTPLVATDKRTWDNRLQTYQKMQQGVGSTGVSRLYDTETQAGLDEYAAITADTDMAPDKRADAINRFLIGAKQDRITGISTNSAIRKEIMDEKTGIMKSLQEFAAEGGGDSFLSLGTPDDLQPVFTTQSNSDTAMDSYAVRSLAGNYSIYRRQKPTGDPQDALRRSKNDFLAQNLWVNWDSKATYVPREFGENFAVRGMKYVEDSGILSKLSVSEGLPVDAIKRKVTIEPSHDYHISRRLSVFYDGIEQDENFDLGKFDKNVGAMDAATRIKYEQENSDLRNSQTFKDRQKMLDKFHNSLGTFTFGAAKY